MPTITSDHRAIPQWLKQQRHWILWALDEEGRKLPFAPWQRGDLYPVKWGADADTRPETDWQTAYQHYRSRGAYASPDGIDPDEMLPAPILLHEPLDPPLMLVDFDDVRDPATGEVTHEAAELLDELDAFAEISSSGTGLHALVRAELPGQLGKFIGALEDTGDIELYDHGRLVGATWDHVPDTPRRVPERQDLIEDIIKRYEDTSQRERRVAAERRSDSSGSPSVSLSARTRADDSDDESGPSPYFDVDIRTVATTGWFANYRRKAPGDEWSGPHPGHGPVHSDPEDSTNFGIEPAEGVWYCFAHDAGGRGIELAAVLCPDTAISCGDIPGENRSVGGWLRDRPAELLRTCLWLRDQGAVAEDAKPPYAALLAVAEQAELHIRDEADGILGEANAEVARAVYDQLDRDAV
jgi:hypothetical protein